MEVRLTVIGCSPAWPNPGGAHSGYLVEADGCGRLLLDCGPGVLSRLRDWDLLPVDAIAITHFHLDHWGDLVPWCWLHASGYGPGTLPQLFVPPRGAVALAQIAEFWGHSQMFQGVFDVTEYGAGACGKVAGFELCSYPVQHYDMDAYAFSVTDPAGRVLAYSGDTAPCDGVRTAAKGAHLFLCEATLSSGERDANVRGHMAADEAIAMAGESRLLLTHRPEELATPDGVERAVEGLCAEV
jgi:ribonuclease BN (tRNA processing enzyme)